MSIFARIFVAGCAAAVITVPARAQFGGMSMRGTTVGVSVDTPIGTFDELAKSGFGIALRSGGGSESETWTGRSSFVFDRFDGKTIYDNIQFVSVGFDIVHRSRPSFYQFGGLTLGTARFTPAPGVSGSGGGRQSQEFGLTGGIGVNFGREPGLKGFIEFAATTVFTSPENSSWFPIRMGIRF